MSNRPGKDWPRLAVSAGFGAALLAVLLGCDSLRLVSFTNDKKEKEEKDGKPGQLVSLPSMKTFRDSQYVYHADFDLKTDLPLFRELASLRDQVYKELQLPSANTIVQVYLFRDRGRYEAFMAARYRDLPKRRAFFVAQPHSVGGGEDLLVYTYWSDRIRQDLRHELTHALLHSVLKDVPLWLDEGLAEYYEVPPEWNGVNYQHLDLFRRNEFKPDLQRLEKLSQVAQMAPGEYREAWAWTHLMLRGPAEARTVLLAHLQQLRTNANPGLLQPRLAAEVPALPDALLKHLAELNAGAYRPMSTQR